MSDSSPNSTRVGEPARILQLADHQLDDLSQVTSAAERVAMVAVLSKRMWEITGRAFPSYTRSEMPVKLVRHG